MLFQVHDSGSFKLSVLQQLFDELCTVLYEGSLLLRKVESVHQDTCRTIRGAAREVLSFLESLIPITQNSKVKKNDFNYTITTLICLELDLMKLEILIDFYRKSWTNVFLLNTMAP